MSQGLSSDKPTDALFRFLASCIIEFFLHQIDHDLLISYRLIGGLLFIQVSFNVKLSLLDLRIGICHRLMQ